MRAADTQIADAHCCRNVLKEFLIHAPFDTNSTTTTQSNIHSHLCCGQSSHSFEYELKSFPMEFEIRLVIPMARYGDNENLMSSIATLCRHRNMHFQMPSQRESCQFSETVILQFNSHFNRLCAHFILISLPTLL